MLFAHTVGKTPASGLKHQPTAQRVFAGASSSGQKPCIRAVSPMTAKSTVWIARDSGMINTVDDDNFSRVLKATLKAAVVSKETATEFQHFICPFFDS